VTTVGVLDYGLGNRRSVCKALEHVGAQVSLSADPDVLRAADGLVVPGVGAFAEAMRRLRARGLDRLIVERAGAGTPLLGLCLGMQLLFDGSEEGEPTAGLGLIPGDVRRLRAPGARLPHIGWSMVSFVGDDPLIADVPRDCAFYHVHSYACHPAEASDVLGTAVHGERFCAAVTRGTLSGCQFHPEKSSAHGLALLRAFVARCATVPA
jgi:glutamine amidotransferase